MHTVPQLRRNELSRGVFMHFTGWLAAATCDEPGKAITAELVGAKHEHEVSIMNGLSVNLRLPILILKSVMTGPTNPSSTLFQPPSHGILQA